MIAWCITFMIFDVLDLGYTVFYVPWAVPIAAGGFVVLLLILWYTLNRT